MFAIAYTTDAADSEAPVSGFEWFDRHDRAEVPQTVGSSNRQQNLCRDVRDGTEFHGHELQQISRADRQSVHMA